MNVNAKNNLHSILVLGAGELGMAMLRSLANTTGTRVSVLLRSSTIESSNPEKVAHIQQIRDLGIGLVAGDLVDESIGTLANCFAPFDTVICCTGFIAGSGTQIKITQAVLEARVKRYVPWQFGVDYDLVGKGSGQTTWDEQLDVRAMLRGQNSTEWVIVSTGMFTSYLFDPAFGIVNFSDNSVNALGAWDNAVTLTTPDDIGVLTREILLVQPRLVNQVVYTAGETITYQQLADLLDKVLGKKVKRIAWSLAKLSQDLANSPEDIVAKYRVAFAKGKGVSWPMEQSFNVQHNIPLTNVEQWLQRNHK
ncbi:aromatic alcohol reductase [Rouxiella sp. Mn2063]|uniref:aromatic alcohol reductase n=1 Tax=Rouxiella sp. Mn2063 TaxID=3395262 RepID=UPI003BE76EC9